jgi:hypothetical protein
MESSTRTGELEHVSIEPASFEPAGFHPTGEPSTTEAPSTELPTTEVHPSMVAAIHEGCPVCGAAMAADQRYCLECGERRGPPRVPPQAGSPQPAAALPSRRRARRAGMSVNATLIAGVGTLLLALGIGVLIGRSGNSASSKAPPVRIVTVAGAAGTGAAAAGSTASTGATGGSATSTTSSAAAGSTTKSSSKPAVKKPTVPLPKPVKVGSPGHGKGYQNGHFTGNFFGGEE